MRRGCGFSAVASRFPLSGNLYVQVRAAEPWSRGNTRLEFQGQVQDQRRRSAVKARHGEHETSSTQRLMDRQFMVFDRECRFPCNCVLLVFVFCYLLIGGNVGFSDYCDVWSSSCWEFLNHEICQQSFRVTIIARMECIYSIDQAQRQCA